MYLPNNCKLLQIALKMRRPIVVLCCGIKVLVVSSTVLCSLVFLHRLYSYSQEATVAPHSYKEDPQTSGEDYPLPRNQPHTQLVHFSNIHLPQKASPFTTGDLTIAKSTLPTEKGMNSIPNKETGKSINLNIATEEINNNTAAAVVTGAQRTAMTFPSPVANSLFTIKPYFHWPQPQSIKSMETLVESGWIRELHKTLLHMNTSQVTLVTSNQAYTEVLLNWLVAAVTQASVKLTEVMIIALDQRLHGLLKERGLNSVLISPPTFLWLDLQHNGLFPVVMMIRLAIIRLLNHWGYDVVNYDTDAILLKDPTGLLGRNSHAEIVGTFGKFPPDLHRRWGITLCPAMLVVRSSQLTEEFWEACSRAKPGSYSDQGKINYGLQALGIHWSLSSQQLSSLSREVQGVCQNGLRVRLLPYSTVCRAGYCTRRSASSVYVWHKGGERVGEEKKKSAEEGKAWFLHSKWKDGCNNEAGEEWIKCIANVM